MFSLPTSAFLTSRGRSTPTCEVRFYGMKPIRVNQWCGGERVIVVVGFFFVFIVCPAGKYIPGI